MDLASDMGSWNLATFSSPQWPVDALHDLWLDQQWDDLVATLTLLASKHPQKWDEWCCRTAERLRILSPHERAQLLANPSFVSWQQLLEVELTSDDARARPSSFAPRKQHTFHRTDFDAFMFPLFPSPSDHHCPPLSCEIRPNIEFTLQGTGYTLLTGSSAARCHRLGPQYFLGGERLADLSGEHVMWEELCKAGSVRVAVTPMYDGKLELGATAPYLTDPFQTSDCFFGLRSFYMKRGVQERLVLALDHLRLFWPDMWKEVLTLNRQIVLFIEGRRPHTVSSFSSNIAPGCIYLCPYVSGEIISLGDSLDALVHEHCHQKLYFLEALTPLYDPGYIGVHPSPWKEEPRPIGGILHGYFVFSMLSRFWSRVAESGHVLSKFARRRLIDIRPQLESAHDVLEELCPFTASGRDVFGSLDDLEQ